MGLCEFYFSYVGHVYMANLRGYGGLCMSILKNKIYLQYNNMSWVMGSNQNQNNLLLKQQICIILYCDLILCYDT